MTKSNYSLLIEKLDQFIRKFYVNKMVRGTLYTLALVLVLFLSFNFLERYFYLNADVEVGSTARQVLFYSFVGLTTLAFIFWIGVPFAKYLRLGKVISHENAATIIGDHFGDVKDKLLNILQLKHQAERMGNPELVLAGIDQKSEDIKLVPFKNAIDLGQNRKYLRFVLPPLLLLMVILFAAPSLIKDSTNRLIKNGIAYERPAPFQFILEEQDLDVVQYENFKLIAKVEGEALPNEAAIEVDGYEYRMKKEDASTFSYEFNKVQDNKQFQLVSSGVVSERYELNVLKKPNLADFEVRLDFPKYINRKREKLNSIGDLVVPAGTNINWLFDAQNTDDIAVKFSSQAALASTERNGKNIFGLSHRAMNSESYKLYISNEDLPNGDSVNYTLTVIPDDYPTINVQQFKDSINQKLLYFVGDAADDYGLLSLSFNYQIQPKEGAVKPLQTLKLTAPNSTQIDYDYQFDINEITLQPGDQLSYYFEVYDNDGVNGNKSARTNLMLFAMPTVEEYEAKEEENDEAIKDQLKKAVEENKELQKEMKEMRDKLLQKKELDWQDKKELEKLLERQEELQQQIQDAKEKFKENLQNQQEFREQTEQILEKQEQLEELFEEAMDEETQKLMEEIQKLMEQLEKDGALEMLEEMQMNDEETELELDRMLELFKELELEQEMQEMVNKLEELAERQEELQEETEETAENQEQGDQENSENEGEQEQGEEQQEGEQQEQDGAQQQDEEEQKTQEELQQEQEQINEEFDKLQEKMEDIEKKNQELERPRNMESQDEEMEKIEQQLDNSQQQLQQQQNKKASKSQKNAAQQMRRQAQKMAQSMQSQQQMQMQEDIQALRQLLENLVALSFDQEDLMNAFNPTDVNTPKYVELVQEQFKLRDDFRLIEDSLQALAKRNFQIESIVTEKVSEIKTSMRKTVQDLEERRKPKAAEYQQRSMKNVNDLALLLSEAMQNMQQQMAMSMPGQQACENPGSSNPNPNSQGVPKDQMSQGQQKLNDAMQKMKEGMQQNGEQGSAKEFAQMAARQAALRNALKEKQKELMEQGQGSKELQDAIEQMNKVEEDLVNKRLTNEMLKRQQNILDQLLEHEKAARQKEYDNQRQADRPTDVQRTIPPSLEEYLKKREAEVSPYQTISPNLKPYYKSLVEKYIQSLKQGE